MTVPPGRGLSMLVPALTRPTWASVDLNALRANARLLRGAIGSSVDLMAVVKADAYGHGALAVVPTLIKLGVKDFGVATLEEALQIRSIHSRVRVVLLGALEPKALSVACRAHIAITVWNASYLDDAERAARRHGRLEVHLKVDTGMSRLGLSPQEAPAAVASFIYGRWPSLKLVGAYTHLACADERVDRATNKQLSAFNAIAWPAGLRRHVANSAATLRYPKARLDMVRAGLFLYGALDPAMGPLARRQRPVLGLHSRVVRVASIPKGQGVSYGHAFKAKRPTKVATLCVGYADGVPRAISPGARVRVAGKLCPVIGRVCMDFMMIDVSTTRDVHPGTPVDLMYAGPGGQGSARAWAALSGTNAYEILCGIRDRVPRKVLG